MALWVPRRDAEISENEHLGRRRFKRPQLIGFTGREDKPALTHLDFLDERDYEISVDRLGKNGVDAKIKDAIRPLAATNAERRTPKVVFFGWASIQVKKFTQEVQKQKLPYTVRPDPVSGSESDANEYHALICCPTDRNHLEVALYLHYLFTKHGAIHEAEPVPRRGILKLVKEWLGGHLAGRKSE